MARPTIVTYGGEGSDPRTALQVPDNVRALVGMVNEHATALDGMEKPYVDLANTPYYVVAGSSAAGAANTAAVKQALSDYAATGARLHFPAGRVYLDQDATTHNSIDVNGLSGFVIEGEGMFTTTLVMEGDGNSGQWILLSISEGSSKIVVRDLGVEQGTVTNPDPGKNMYGISVRNLSSATPTQDIEIYNVYLSYFKGGVFQVFGQSASYYVDGVHLHHFIGRGNLTPATPSAGCRSIIEFQRGYQNVEIDHFYAEGATNSVIDMEPTGGAPLPMERFSIHDGTVKNTGTSATAVSLAGVVTATVTSRNRFYNMRVLDGQVQVATVDQLDMFNVELHADGSGVFAGQTVPLLYVFDINTHHIFRDIRVWRDATCSVGLCIQISDNNGHFPSDIAFVGGYLYQGTTANAIKSDSCDKLTISCMTIEMAAADLTNCKAVYVESQNQDISRVAISDLLIKATTATLPDGVRLNANNSKAVSGATLTGLRFSGGVTNGITFDSSDSTGPMEPHPVIQGCDFSACTTPWRAITGAAGLVFPCVAGNVGDYCTYTGGVAPESAVTAKQGSMYIYQNGDSSALYVKSTGTGNTGWTALTIP